MRGKQIIWMIVLVLPLVISCESNKDISPEPMPSEREENTVETGQSFFQDGCHNCLKPGVSPLVIKVENGENLIFDDPLDNIGLQSVYHIEVLKPPVSVEKFGKKAQNGAILVYVK